MDKKYYKLVVLGEGRVGKTSLTLRYCKGEFDDEQISTNNASYLEKQVNLDSGEEVHIAIWDTAGQEKFNALAPMYYRDALGAILVYDITFKESFDKVHKWITELKQFAGKNIFLVIAGNKCDLENKRQIKLEDAEQFAKSYGAHHFQVSAKADQGVEELFQTLVKGVHAGQQQKKATVTNKKKKNKLKVGGGSEKVQKVDKNAIYSKQNQGQDSSDDEGNNKNNGKLERDSSDEEQQQQQKQQKEQKGSAKKEKKQKKEEPSKKEKEAIKLKSGKKEKKKKDGCC